MTIKPQTIMHLTITIIVVVWWFVVTDVSNYVWFGESVIESDLSRIFWFKFILWSLFFNLLYSNLRMLFHQEWKYFLISLLGLILLFFPIQFLVDKECAYNYYKVFSNQNVGEAWIERPIHHSGYEIGKFLEIAIQNKNYHYRLYAISGLAEIDFTDAIPTLTQIANDTTESEFIIHAANRALSILQEDDK